MKRVVFSVYIDLSEYDDEPYAKDHFSKLKSTIILYGAIRKTMHGSVMLTML